MQQKKIERINELAKKAREVGLSEAERLEQKALRQEYVDAFKESLTSQLERVVLVEKDGTQIPLKKRVRKKADARGTFPPPPGLLL